MTALEIAGLDLWGTSLVVLSACDTGVGDVRSGEGVYGLRRALMLAGSETQIMSLWPVDDAATKDMMSMYHRLLGSGFSRSEAFRKVKLSFITGTLSTATGTQRNLSKLSSSRRLRRSHPYFWASFIQLGEWAELAAKN